MFVGYWSKECDRKRARARLVFWPTWLSLTFTSTSAAAAKVPLREHIKREHCRSRCLRPYVAFSNANAVRRADKRRVSSCKSRGRTANAAHTASPKTQCRPRRPADGLCEHVSRRYQSGGDEQGARRARETTADFFTCDTITDRPHVGEHSGNWKPVIPTRPRATVVSKRS